MPTILQKILRDTALELPLLNEEFSGKDPGVNAVTSILPQPMFVRCKTWIPSCTLRCIIPVIAVVTVLLLGALYTVKSYGRAKAQIILSGILVPPDYSGSFLSFQYYNDSEGYDSSVVDSAPPSSSIEYPRETPHAPATAPSTPTRFLYPPRCSNRIADPLPIHDAGANPALHPWSYVHKFHYDEYYDESSSLPEWDRSLDLTCLMWQPIRESALYVFEQRLGNSLLEEPCIPCDNGSKWDKSGAVRICSYMWSCNKRVLRYLGNAIDSAADLAQLVSPVNTADLAAALVAATYPDLVYTCEHLEAPLMLSDVNFSCSQYSSCCGNSLTLGGDRFLHGAVAVDTNLSWLVYAVAVHLQGCFPYMRNGRNTRWSGVIFSVSFDGIIDVYAHQSRAGASSGKECADL